MILRPAGVALAMIGAAASAQPTRLPQLLAPPTIYSVPTPAPLAPPTNPGPAVAPPAGLSPLLSQPWLASPTLPREGSSSPPAASPSPLDQQQMQAYRNSLLGQRWQLERQGVSPDSRRYRELQRQLNQPDSR
jgi:hypothetical protein